MATPSVEEMLQQLILGQQRIMEKIDEVVGQSTATDTRLDEISKRVEDFEFVQSMAVHPTQILWYWTPSVRVRDQSHPPQPTVR